MLPHTEQRIEVGKNGGKNGPIRQISPFPNDFYKRLIWCKNGLLPEQPDYTQQGFHKNSIYLQMFGP